MTRQPRSSNERPYGIGYRRCSDFGDISFTLPLPAAAFKSSFRKPTYLKLCKACKTDKLNGPEPTLTETLIFLAELNGKERSVRVEHL